MFGLKKSSNSEETLPIPPSCEDILEDLNKAGPDDVVFATNIADLSANLDQASRHFQLQKRFQTTKERSSNSIEESELYEKVIEYNQNVEKLGTLGSKLSKKLADLAEVKEVLAEDLAKVYQDHNQAVKQYQKINQNDNAKSDSKGSLWRR